MMSAVWCNVETAGEQIKDYHQTLHETSDTGLSPYLILREFVAGDIRAPQSVNYSIKHQLHLYRKAMRTKLGSPMQFMQHNWRPVMRL